MKSKHCLVIGAGLAGLAAAFRLLNKGWTVEVLEAEKERLGGRVFTQRRVRKGLPPLDYELGGEWIGTSHTRMKQLCSQFNLAPLRRHRYSFAFVEKGVTSKFCSPGTLPFARSSNSAFNKFMARVPGFNQCEQQALDRIDWWTKVRELGFDQKDLLRRDLMDSTDFGESIRHTSGFVGATEYSGSNQTDEMDYKVPGGNDRLIYAFAAAIKKQKGRIYSACEAKRIDQANGQVTVTARSGKKFTGDACICAIPASQLHRIRWHPALPPEQLSAARELQYARIIKTAFVFPQRFWPKFSRSGFSLFTSQASDFCFDSTFRQEGPEGIICSYAIGDKADDLADEPGASLAKWISEDLLDAVLPGKSTDREKLRGSFLKRQPWQREKCIGGAYAFYRPGQWFHVRPTLLRPHQRVLFAGEHLSEAWQGFMEGAVETGEAAADVL